MRAPRPARPAPHAAGAVRTRCPGWRAARCCSSPSTCQRTGSFKIRGAYNLISRLPEGGEVVAASAGNHAQGVALAASLTGQRGRPSSCRRTRPCPRSRPPAPTAPPSGSRAAWSTTAWPRPGSTPAETGAVFVPPFDDPLIIAGQGTVGLELAEEAPDAEVVVVPVGGGGLISGVATALAHTRRGCQVIGVEAAGADADAGGPEGGQARHPRQRVDHGRRHRRARRRPS